MGGSHDYKTYIVSESSHKLMIKYYIYEESYVGGKIYFGVLDNHGIITKEMIIQISEDVFKKLVLDSMHKEIVYFNKK